MKAVALKSCRITNKIKLLYVSKESYHKTDNSLYTVCNVILLQEVGEEMAPLSILCTQCFKCFALLNHK